MIPKNLLSPLFNLIDDDNEIIFSEKELKVFENRERRSLFRESIVFWPGVAGVHHSNGLVILQKNINDLDLIKYICDVLEAIKFPATGQCNNLKKIEIKNIL